jgi:hypothetical protein
VLVVPIASAATPTKTRYTNSGGPDTYLAGELCDFAYEQTWSEISDVTTFSDREEYHTEYTIVHTNVDTGYTLTEIDRVNYTVTDVSEKVVGVDWHFRDASGKWVVVHAGQIVYGLVGDDWQIVKFTPNSGPDYAAVICTALGGNSAP